MRPATAWKLLAVTLIALLLCAGVGLQLAFLFQIPFFFAFGWIPYLFRVVPEVTTSPSGITIGLLALLISIVLCHTVTAWLWNHFHPTQPWRPRWTLSCYLLVLLTFTAGICIVSITHQSYWIFSSPEPFIDSDWNIRDAARASSLQSQLQAIRMGLARYRNDHQGKFPTLAQLSDWSVLTNRTDASGNVAPAGPFGPYIQSVPANPFTQYTSVCPVTAPNLDAGWAYDEATGDLRAIILRFHVRNLRQPLPDADVLLLY